MPALRSLRVRIALADPPLASWQRLVADAIGSAGIPVVEQDADVVVDLGGDVTGAAPRFGVWRYGFGDGAPAADGAAGTLARLYRVGPDPSTGVVLREGWFRGGSDDAVGTRDVGARVAPWCASVLRQMRAEGSKTLAGAGSQPVDGCQALLPPSRAGSLIRLARHAVQRWRRRERWTLGILGVPLADLVAGRALIEPTWVTGVRSDRYLADPFPLSAQDGLITLLAEEYRYADGRGRIVSLDVGLDGAIAAGRPWLAPPHHVAYPFVLRDGADAVCVPDGAAAGSIRAYAIDAPTGSAATLIDGFAGVDPTLLHHDGRWWLFCTDRHRENQTDLHVFHADQWRGPWRPHALNPVKSDARSSRPAGAFFTIDGALHRPAQDCSRRYGGAITIMRIEELTPTRFRERVVVTLRPGAGWAWPHGMHTLNAIGDIVLVDGLRVER